MAHELTEEEAREICAEMQDALGNRFTCYVLKQENGMFCVVTMKKADFINTMYVHAA